MDGMLFNAHIMPDQMQVMNPIIVLLLIPIFERMIYPCFNKFHIMENSLHRMAIGGIMAGLAFLCAGVLELFLQQNYPKIPNKNYSFLYIINTLHCDLKINNTNIIHSGKMQQFIEKSSIYFNTTVEISSNQCKIKKNSLSMEINIVEEQV